MNDICIRIKELRKKLEMSQVEFAKKLGVTNAHISKIEKGGTVPSEALIKLISKEYQVNENWIKKGTEPIFIYEIEEQTDESLINSTEIFNHLLSSDSYVIRELASELKMLFSNITNVDSLDDKQKIEYLYIVKDMLTSINQYNSLIKMHLNTKQLILEDAINNHFENYKKEVENCINEYKKMIIKSV